MIMIMLFDLDENNTYKGNGSLIFSYAMLELRQFVDKLLKMLCPSIQ